MSTWQTTTSTSGDISTEQMLRLLRHGHRRAIVMYFDQATADSASVDEVVDYIISPGSKRNGAKAAERRRWVTIDLFHNHLPRLADAGVLEYDQRSGTIRYSDDDRFETLVAFARRAENAT